MNPLNKWISIPVIAEDDRNFLTWKKVFDLCDSGAVENYSRLVAFKIVPNGAAVRFNKQILGGTHIGLSILKEMKINIDVLKFDDYYRTELSTIFLYELMYNVTSKTHCAHCFNPLFLDFETRMLKCTHCEYTEKP